MSVDRKELRKLVVDSLEAARVEVERRLVEAELPSSISTTRLVMSTDGSGGAWETHSSSSLNSFNVLVGVKDGSVQFFVLGLREQLEPLAVYLSENSDLGGARETGLLPTLTGVDGVLSRVLVPLTLHYLRSLEDVKTPDKTLVSSLVADLYTLATARTVSTTKQLGLGGVRVDSEYRHRAMRIRPLTGVEMGSYASDQGSTGGPSLEPPAQFQVPRTISNFIPTAVVEADEEWALEDKTHHSAVMHRFILACFLSGVDVDTTGVVVSFENPRSASSGSSHSPFPVGSRQFSHGLKILGEDGFQAIVELAEKIPDFGPAEQTREDIVFHRLLQGLDDEESGFLDLVISLESAASRHGG